MFQGNNLNWAMGWWGTTGFRHYSVSANVGGTENTAPGQLVIAAATHADTSAFYLNGKLQGTGVAGFPATFSLGGLGGFSSEPINGDLAELLIFNRVLSANELSNVQRYVADKYSLYHPNAAWIAAYSAGKKTLIHSGRLSKKQIDALIAANIAISPVTIPGLTGSGPKLHVRADGPLVKDANNLVSH
jgi:hypothetical protein